MSAATTVDMIVDVRERHLITALGGTDTIKTAQLPLGDVVLTWPGKTIYIERKTIADLLSSIKDGRYEEQSFRLAKEVGGHTHDVIYLIEGPTPKKEADRATLYSALFSLEFYKGFSIMRTDSVDETAAFILNTVKRIEKNNRDGKYPYAGYFTVTSAAASATADHMNADGTAAASPEPADKAYITAAVSGVSKKVKRDNITVHNINELMLCTIPGISAKTAGAIIGRYGSIENLIIELRAHGVASINGPGGVKADRRISKAVLSSINRFLLSSDNISGEEGDKDV